MAMELKHELPNVDIVRIRTSQTRALLKSSPANRPQLLTKLSPSVADRRGRGQAATDWC